MLVVITGGPFSGKTTLIEAFSQRGHHVVPEAAIQVIGELNDELGTEGQQEFRKHHRGEFQQLVLKRQIAQEEAALAIGDGRPVFLDRSRIDGLAYCRHFDEEPPAELRAAVTQIRFHAVFVLETLKNAHVRADTGRTSDRATSVALRDHLLGIYRELGYEPVQIPEMSVTDRAAKILRDIESA